MSSTSLPWWIAPDPFFLIMSTVVLFPIVKALRKQRLLRLQEVREQKAAVAAHTLELHVRSALIYIHWLIACQRFILFLLFFVIYALLTTTRVDWWKGSQTLQWLQAAHDVVGLTPIDQLDTTSQVSLMLDDGLPAVISHLKTICTACSVGLTPVEKDMRPIGLESFICSDFYSVAGRSDYPDRDCAEADSAWAAHPDADSAPCCDNSSLVTASIAMMVEHIEFGITTMPLEQLLSGGTDPDFKRRELAATEYFVSHYIDIHQFIMQVSHSTGGSDCF